MSNLNTSKKRVVITGLGAITPLGLNFQDTWDGLLAERSGITRTTSFDLTDCPVTISGEVKGFDINRPVGPFYPAPGQILQSALNTKEARKVGRFTHLGIAAGLEAYGDSGLDALRGQIPPERIGVNLAAGIGGFPEFEAVHNEFLAKGYRRVTPFFIPQVIPNMLSGQLSILLNLKGPNLCNVAACTSSAHSIGESVRLIQRGDVDVMLAGGAEATLCKMAVAGFAAMKALSALNDFPEKASRPFDKDRDGFIMSEGAAVLVLEDLEFARRRGARIYAEVVGYGISGDAYHMTAPAPEGEGGRRAMELSLQDARLNPEEIGYLNAHATSTPLGDIEEARAIAQVFQNAPKHLHVSSTKSSTGHLLGAAGALEAAFCVKTVQEGKIPPTLNLDHLDPTCAALGLDYTALRGVEKPVEYALSNSFGFGGTNASLIIGRMK